MSVFASKLGLALSVAALCLGARTACAQAAAVPYASWPIGFGSNLTVGQSSNIYGAPGFDGGAARGAGFSVTRTNFPNGFFVGGEGGGLGFGMSGLNQAGAFGNTRFSYEGAQFGYDFRTVGGLPLTVYAGFDTLKYDVGIGSPFAPFDTMSGTLPGYRAHAGVEFQPAPNVSLSLGVGYTQSGRVDSELNSLSLPGASPFAPGVRR
jgi:opacity protein-like surface antigen